MRMQRRINRPQPLGRPQDYRTYAMRAPLGTHFRPSTCDEYGCPAYTNGWSIRLEGLTAQLAYVARHSGRRYREMEVAPGETYLVYEPGQTCFDRHVLPLDRPQWYFTGRGDYRIFNVRNARQFERPEDFIEDMQSHLDSLRRIQERG